jgi:hypothetical protein
MTADISIPRDIHDALVDYAAAEKKRMKEQGCSPIILDMITWRSVAQHILRDRLQRLGHWEPKGKKREGR